MSYEQITVRPATGTFGATVGGVDISQPLDEATLREIRSAWLEYQVLFFRGQEMTPHQLCRPPGTRWSAPIPKPGASRCS